MYIPTYWQKERGEFRSKAFIFGSDWAIKEVINFLNKIAQDSDMTSKQKEMESYFFKLVIKDCLKQEEMSHKYDF